MSENKKSFSSSLYSNLDTLLQSVLGDDILLTVDRAIQDYIKKVEICKIDYSNVKDDDIKQQLENDNQMMLIARARNNFIEYCKCASFSIESVLEYFYEKNKQSYDSFVSIPQNKKFLTMGKYGKFAHWWNFMGEGQYASDDYWEIVYLFKIRDATSHQRLGVTSVVELISIFNQRQDEKFKSQVINFYERKDFEIVKNMTEWIVKKTLVHFNLLS